MNSQQCDYVIDLNNDNTMARHAITSYSYVRSKFAYITKYVKCTNESIYLEIYDSLTFDYLKQNVYMYDRIKIND